MTTTATVVPLFYASTWAWCAVEERVPGREPHTFVTIVPKEMEGVYLMYEDGTGEWVPGVPGEHRYPSWMSFRLHITLEGLMCHVPRVFFKNPVTMFVYDFIYGVMCSYPLIEILRWCGGRGS